MEAASMFQRFFKSKPKEPMPTAQPVKATVDEALAYRLMPDGRLHAVKSTSGGGYDAATEYYANRETLPANEQGYASAYIHSAWAFRCVEVRAAKVGELLRQAFVVNKDTGATLETNPLQDMAEWAFRQHQQDCWEAWERALCIYGESYTEIIRNAFDRPVGLWNLNPLAIEPVIVGNHIVSYAYYGDQRVLPLDKECVLFDKKPSPVDDLRGLSPMRIALREVGIDMAISRFTSNYYKNNAFLGVLFTLRNGAPTIGDSDFTKFLTRIEEQTKGSKNAFKPLVLTLPLEATVLEPPALTDQQALSDAMKERICAVFGVPVGMVSFSDAKYQLSPEQRESFYNETAIPEVEHILRLINASGILPPQLEARLDRSKISALAEDENEKAQLLSTRYRDGSITLNEYRTKLGDEPVEGGDRLLINGQLIPVDELSTPQLPEPTPVQDVITVDVDPVQQRIAEGRKAGRILDAKHTDKYAELQAWRKATLGNRNKGLRFVTYLVDDTTRDSVLQALREGLGVDDAFHVVVATKAIGATQADFERAFDELLTFARNGTVDKRTFASSLRSLLRSSARRAFADGLEEGGVLTTEISNEDEAEIALFLTEQSAYVADLANTLYSDTGVSNAQADVKSGLWWNKSVVPAYHLGKVAADANGLYEFQLGATEEHCTTCAALNTQRHRLRDWARRNLIPPTDATECGGWHCQCTIKRVSGRERGGWA